MLSKLRQLAQQWLDKYYDVEYFSAHPYAATIRSDLNYRQVLACVKANHRTYISLTTKMYELDAKNGHQLLRAAVAQDPAYITRANDQKSIPADMLLAALDLAHIWELVVDHGWVAYSNPSFKEAYPETTALIDLYRGLNISGREAHDCYRQHQGLTCTPGSMNVALPTFD